MKKFFVMAALAAAVSVFFSCSQSNETVVNPKSIAAYRLPLRSTDPDYARALDASRSFYGQVIDGAYADGELDIVGMEGIVMQHTALTRQQLIDAEMQAEADLKSEVAEAVRQIRLYFRLRKTITDDDVAWVDALCRRQGLSDTERMEVVDGVVIAKLTAESVLSLAVWHGPETRASLDHTLDAEFLQVKGFSCKAFLCNVGCGVVGTLAGYGVQGVIAAAGVAGSASGGSGAVAVVAGAVTGVVVGAVLSTVFC